MAWQPQPLLAEPVLPEELASARFSPDTASKRRLIANARKYGDIPLVVSRLAFDYLGNWSAFYKEGDSPGRNRTDVPGTKTRDDGPLHYRTVVVGP